MEAKSIERLAEEFNVNICDFLPVLKARDELHYKAGMKEVVDTVWNECYGDPRVVGYVRIEWEDWQAKLKEWEVRMKLSNKKIQEELLQRRGDIKFTEERLDD